MPIDYEKAESELQSRIYTGLVEMTLAQKEEKKAIAERIKHSSLQLHDLIVYGMIPEL